MIKTTAAVAAAVLVAGQAVAGPYEGNYFPQFPVQQTDRPAKTGRIDRSRPADSIDNPRGRPTITDDDVRAPLRRGGRGTKR